MRIELDKAINEISDIRKKIAIKSSKSNDSLVRSKSYQDLLNKWDEILRLKARSETHG